MIWRGSRLGDFNGRIPPPALVRDPNKARIHHSRCGETFRGRDGRPVCDQNRRRCRVHQSTFVDCYNGLRIRRELTAPYTPRQNGSVESRLLMVIKAGLAAPVEAIKPCPDIIIERLKGVQDPGGSSLWLQSVLWASKGFNRSATTVNSGMLYPHDVFYGGTCQCCFCRFTSRRTIAFPGGSELTPTHARVCS